MKQILVKSDFLISMLNIVNFHGKYFFAGIVIFVIIIIKIIFFFTHSQTFWNATCTCIVVNPFTYNERVTVTIVD